MTPVTRTISFLLLDSLIAFGSFTRTQRLALRAGSRLGCLALLAGLAVIPLAAQTAYLTNGSQITLGSGFNHPGGVALDQYGNIFVADTGNSAVKEILASSGYTTVNTLASGNFKNPQSLALDAYGNVFVADTGNGAVKVITALGGYTSVSTIVSSGLFGMSPTGVAIDANGNLWVDGAYTSSTVGFFEFLSVSGYTANPIASATTSTDPIPGITVDGSNNVFIGASSSVLEIPAPAHSFAELVGGGQVDNASGLVVDANGNLFVADSGHDAVKELLAASSYTTSTPVGSGFSRPQGVAVDTLGNVFVADTGNSAVVEIPAGSATANFGTIPVGTGTPQTLTYEFVFTSGGTIGAPAVLTQGAAGKDFVDAGTGTCTTNGTSHVYVADETCTVKVTFKPKHPGTRYGAIQLLNNSGMAIVTAPVYGTGTGPQIAFGPGAGTKLGSGFNAPQGVAVDESGHVFVGDTGNNAVKEILSTTVKTLGSGFNALQGVAVDGAGDVFVADTGNNKVKEIVAANGLIPASPTIHTLGSGFSAPTGVAVDQNGNVIVNDTGHGVVKEILAAGGYTTVNTLTGNFTYPVLQATDSRGNVYTADTANDQVLKTDHADPPQLAFAPTTVGSTSSDSPQTVTASNIGNSNLTFPVPSSGKNASISSGFTLGSSTTCADLSSSSSSPVTLTAGASCRYLVNFSPAAAGALDGSLVLTDNNLNASATQTVSLSGSTLTSQSINFTPPSTVNFGVSPITLTASATSGLTVTFTKQSGPGTITGNVLTVTGAGTIVIVADQAGNASYAPAETTAEIVVGMATPSITWANPDAIQYGTPLSATQLDAVLSVAGSCTYLPAAGTVLSAGPQTLTANCTPTDTTDYNSVSKTVSLTVSVATSTVTWATPAAIAYGTPLSATQLDATLSVAGSCTYLPAAGTILSAGTQTLTANCTPTDTTNYNSVSKTVSLTVNMATPTVTWAHPVAIAYGTPLSATQLDAALSVAGSCTYLPVAGTVLTAGTQSITASCTPTDSTDYNSVSKTISLWVNKATPTVTWPSASSITVGQTLASSTLSGGSAVAGSTPVAGTFAFTTPTTAPGAGTQSESVTFTPTDLSDSRSVTGTVSVIVNKGTLNVTWPTASPLTYGQSLSSSALSGGAAVSPITSATVAGTFAFTTPAVVPIAGLLPESVTFTPTDTADYPTVTGTVNVSVSKATPLIVWPAPTAITYGTALSAAQLDAASTVPGTFLYTPSSGVLTVGGHMLSVLFTPTDTLDYRTNTATVSLQVNKATPVVTWTPATLLIGSKLTTAQLDATANTSGKFTYTPALGTTITSSTQTLKVVFIPTNTTDYNSVTQSVSLPVDVIKVSPTSINFGTVYLDTSTTKTVTVTNLGSAPVTIYTPLISIPTEGDSREFYAINLCLKPLTAHASCTIQVTYVAGPFYHQQSATLSIKSSSAASVQTVSLTALTIDPEARLSTTSLSFGTEKKGTSSAAKSITLTNSGATALALGSVAISGTDPHDFTETSKCGSSLATGSSCSFSVTFKPAAKGARSAKLVIKDNAQSSSQSISLTGTGD